MDNFRATAYCEKNESKNLQVEAIIRKWHKALKISPCYNAEFNEALKKYEITDTVTVDSCGDGSEDGARNLLIYLYLCEELSRKYKEKGIPEEILMDTLSGIPRWLDVHSNIKKKMWLGEIHWLKLYMQMRLFKIGRLEYCFGRCHYDVDDKGIKKGEKIIEIHIPAGEKLTQGGCLESLNMAREFYARYYPEYEYEYFTCESWLLDTALSNVLPENSNILKFGNMFERYVENKKLALLRFVFRWDIAENDLKTEVAPNSFCQRVKDYILEGGEFHETFGIIKK